MHETPGVDPRALIAGRHYEEALRTLPSSIPDHQIVEAMARTGLGELETAIALLSQIPKTDRNQEYLHAAISLSRECHCPFEIHRVKTQLDALVVHKHELWASFYAPLTSLSRKRLMTLQNYDGGENDLETRCLILMATALLSEQNEPLNQLIKLAETHTDSALPLQYLLHTVIKMTERGIRDFEFDLYRIEELISELSPPAPRVYVDHAYLTLRTNDWPRAVILIERLRAFYPKHFEIQLLEARLLRNEGKISEAYDLAHAAYDKIPAHQRAWKLFAHLHPLNNKRSSKFLLIRQYTKSITKLHKQLL